LDHLEVLEIQSVFFSLDIKIDLMGHGDPGENVPHRIVRNFGLRDLPISLKTLIIVMEDRPSFSNTHAYELMNDTIMVDFYLPHIQEIRIIPGKHSAEEEMKVYKALVGSYEKSGIKLILGDMEHVSS
jgi:hypothetical protein